MMVINGINAGSAVILNAAVFIKLMVRQNTRMRKIGRPGAGKDMITDKPLDQFAVKPVGDPLLRKSG